MRRGDRVRVTGQVQIHLLHRHDLRPAAAGCATLDSEHRAHRRLPDRHDRPLPDLPERLAKPDRGRSLALAQRRRRDCRDDHVLAARPPGQRVQRREVDLADVPAVRLQQVRPQSHRGCYLLDRWSIADWAICRSSSMRSLLSGRRRPAIRDGDVTARGDRARGPLPEPGSHRRAGAARGERHPRRTPTARLTPTSACGFPSGRNACDPSLRTGLSTQAPPPARCLGWGHTDSEPEPDSGSGGGQPGRSTGRARPRSGHRRTDGPRPGHNDRAAGLYGHGCARRAMSAHGPAAACIAGA
jgi:hypothetical protein